MDRSNVIKLISITYTMNANYQQIEVKTEREVFCSISSVSLSEWTQAGQNGRKPKYKITMLVHDYNDEQLLKLNNEYYSVYRTYIGKNETIDLYVEEKVGTR